MSKLYDEELSMRIAREIFTEEELEEILLFEEENEIDMDDLDYGYEDQMRRVWSLIRYV